MLPHVSLPCWFELLWVQPVSLDSFLMRVMLLKKRKFKKKKKRRARNYAQDELTECPLPLAPAGCENEAER